MRIMRETWVLAAISIGDLILTLWLISAHLALEANPLMRTLLQQGVGWFIAFKCAYTLGPLVLLEMVSTRHRELVRRYLRLGIVLYVGMHLTNGACALLVSALHRS